jgi:hypothetical protein
MICTNGTCGAEIPAGQAICPACYTIVGDFPEKGPRNVMWFLSNSGLNHLYSSRTLKYLQPERVKWNFHADTEDALDEITRNPEGNWHLLVTDLDRAASAASAIERFRAKHPSCVLAFISGTAGGAAGAANSIFLRSPDDLDAWLAMVRSLLRLT